MLTAVAESFCIDEGGVLAGGRDVGSVARQQQQRQGPRWPMGQYSVVREGLQRAVDAVDNTDVAEGGNRLPDRLLGSILTGPCAKVCRDAVEGIGMHNGVCLLPDHVFHMVVCRA